MKNLFTLFLLGFVWQIVAAQPPRIEPSLNRAWKVEKYAEKALFKTEKLLSAIVSGKQRKAEKQIRKIDKELSRLIPLTKKLQDASEELVRGSEGSGLSNLECGTGFVLVHADFGRRNLIAIQDSVHAGNFFAAGEAASALHNSLLSIRTLSRSIILELVQGPLPIIGKPV